MPLRAIKGADAKYYLIVFDKDGVERQENDGSLLSKTIVERLSKDSEPVTDVFLTSHGWKGDVPAAIEQYDAWVGVVARAERDLQAARRQPGFNPLIIGLHWPSLPWGDETMPSANAPGLLSAGADSAALDREVEAYAARIADTPAAREAIRTILAAAARNPKPGALPPKVRKAYATLFEESKLQTKGVGAAPGADQSAFDPDRIIAEAKKGQTPGQTPGLLGIGFDPRELWISPLRQLSFWKMKDRARLIGETAGRGLLAKIMKAAPGARVHLMGHSFGCIVVSASVAGAEGAEPLPRPVDTLFLAQGALSIWAYTGRIPYAPDKAGYFGRLLANRQVRGPIVTTRSRLDKAVGFFYPLGAETAGQFVLDAEQYPAYAGLGAYGIRGVKQAEDRPMLSAASRYGFEPGGVYNLEASNIIKNGGGASGAHSDIAHPEVAHAFWEAVLTRAPSGGALSPSGGGRQQQQAAATTAAAATARTAGKRSAAATAAARTARKRSAAGPAAKGLAKAGAAGRRRHAPRHRQPDAGPPGAGRGTERRRPPCREGVIPRKESRGEACFREGGREACFREDGGEDSARQESQAPSGPGARGRRG